MGHLMPKGVRAERPTKLRVAPEQRGVARRVAPAAIVQNAAPKDAAPDRPASQIQILTAEVERLERELVAARAEMAELAIRAEVDPLTDVLNRRGFERELKRSLAYVKRHAIRSALLFIDLDDFKGINDRHGHAAGDAVLRAIAMVLSRHVRASDVVARLGGDEFALLLWNCPDTEAQTKAGAIEAAIGRTTATHAGLSLSVGASCGVAALLPLDQAGDVLERADRAMYARKVARRALRLAGGG